jgi:glycosyltransferase involved in cell wall biosynthesis
LKILHIITSLDQGGAEAVLCRLATSKTEAVEHSVISLKGAGFYGPVLVASGIAVHYFDFGQFFRWRSLFEFRRLVKLIAEVSPDVLQTWLYHADLVGGIAARLAGHKAVVWGVRSASLSPLLMGRFTRIVAWFCARLSGLVPAAIATCSQEAAKVHKRRGYNASKFAVIANGFDLKIFKPDTDARKRLRQSWGVSDNEVLTGCVARWDPYKDHANLLEALSITLLGGSQLRCVLVGGGLDNRNPELSGLMAKYNLQDSVILAGMQSDIPSVMNALDLHILSSASEAFPNVVAEAMACGVPAIVTDVGDAALIVGNTGWVVPPKNPPLLSQALTQAVAGVNGEGYLQRRDAARQRIADNFSMEKMTQSYVDLWRSVVSK